MWKPFVALGLCLSSCTLPGQPAHVSLASEPPGGRVLLDGVDSGFVTPCDVLLPADDELKLDLHLPGYKLESRLLVPETQVDTVYWREAYIREQVWRFPLWLQLSDFVRPVKLRSVMRPGGVYVQLERDPSADTNAP